MSGTRTEGALAIDRCGPNCGVVASTRSASTGSTPRSPHAIPRHLTPSRLGPPGPTPPADFAARLRQRRNAPKLQAAHAMSYEERRRCLGTPADTYDATEGDVGAVMEQRLAGSNEVFPWGRRAGLPWNAYLLIERADAAAYLRDRSRGARSRGARSRHRRAPSCRMEPPASTGTGATIAAPS
jgi:hypothetical protein